MFQPQVFVFLAADDDPSSLPPPPPPDFLGKRHGIYWFSLTKQVGQAKDDVLTSQLIDHLMGESDDIPKVGCSGT